MIENASDLDDLALLLKLLRALRGWGQTELAEAAGVDPSSIQRYETGRTVPPRKTVERLVTAVGLPMAFVEACLLPALRSARALLSTSNTETTEASLGVTSTSDPLDQTLLAAARSALAASVGSEQPRFLEPWPRQTKPVAEDRITAEDAWERLRSCSHRERLFLVERAPEFRTWAFAERLSHASVEAAGDNADRALEFAELGVHVATLSGGEQAWLSTLKGYTLGFLANALKVRAAFAKAEETIGEAWKRWRHGKKTELLPVWRIYLFEASLCKELSQWTEALERLDRASNTTPPEKMGHLLLTRAMVFEKKGEVETAVRVLREAEAILDSEREPRLGLALRFNLASCLCQLGRYKEVVELTTEVKQLAERLHNGLDSIRVTWLEARLAGGLGNLSEARSKLEMVYQEFECRGLDYECSLAVEELKKLSDPRRSRPGRGSDRRLTLT